MIIGIGIDIVEVSRIAEKIGKQDFLSKIFSEEEIEYCEMQGEREQSYAARFAAKEAFLKATGKGLTAGFDLWKIEVINDPSGKPVIRLRDEFEAMARSGKWNKILLSLSHVKSTACAVVIIEE
jgi:holo-[acyl-carrier protein] synthase